MSTAATDPSVGRTTRRRTRVTRSPSVECVFEKPGVVINPRRRSKLQPTKKEVVTAPRRRSVRLRRSPDVVTLSSDSDGDDVAYAGEYNLQASVTDEIEKLATRKDKTGSKALKKKSCPELIIKIETNCCPIILISDDDDDTNPTPEVIELASSSGSSVQFLFDGPDEGSEAEIAVCGPKIDSNDKLDANDHSRDGHHSQGQEIAASSAPLDPVDLDYPIDLSPDPSDTSDGDDRSASVGNSLRELTLDELLERIFDDDWVDIPCDCLTADDANDCGVPHG